MGIRGVVRDIIGIYLGIVIVIGYLTNNFKITTYTLIAGIILLLLGLWFLLERFGAIPKTD